jgi:hypothetical protein
MTCLTNKSKKALIKLFLNIKKHPNKDLKTFKSYPKKNKRHLRTGLNALLFKRVLNQLIKCVILRLLKND